MEYQGKVVYKNGVWVLCLEVLKAIYGMLVASFLWYQKLWADLEQIGFKFNPYDPCVANRMWNGRQQTVCFHVDDLLVSCKDKKQMMSFTSGVIVNVVKCTRGGKHTFLGMVLDFDVEPGAVYLIQDKHISDIIDNFPKDVKGNSPSPAQSNLFGKGISGVLCKNKKEIFHTIVVKELFLTKCSRPDIGLPISVLRSRVRAPVKDGWWKLR